MRSYLDTVITSEKRMSKQRLAMQHAVSLTITADTEQLAVNLTPVTRQTSIPSQVLANIWGLDDSMMTQIYLLLTLPTNLYMGPASKLTDLLFIFNCRIDNFIPLTSIQAKVSTLLPSNSSEVWWSKGLGFHQIYSALVLALVSHLVIQFFHSL